MQESQSDFDGIIVMTLFTLQRCSLLFRFDQFGDSVYNDFKLQTLQGLTNWSTLQTPLHMINNREFEKVALYIICFLFWLILATLFTSLRVKRFLKTFFTYYQLLIFIPSLEVVVLNFQQDINIALGVVTLSAIIICYWVFFFVHRNYQLPQKNCFLRRYSYYNLVLVIADFGIIVVKFSKNEMAQTAVIICVNFFFLIDSFAIQPYQISINKKYIYATSAILCLSFLKLFAFQNTQSEIFFFILLLTPFYVSVMVQFYQQFIYYQIYGRYHNCEILLMIADIISQETSNPILIDSILMHLKFLLKIVIDTDNKNLRIQSTIIQLFNLEIESRKNSTDTNTIENIQLYKIMYITTTCKRTQLGYIELKLYETISIKQSFYFRVISRLLQDKMAKINHQSTKDRDKRLSLTNIRRTEILFEDSLELLMKILVMKIKFWNDLNKGYQKIEELAKSAIRLSEQIWSIRNHIFSLFNIDPFDLSAKLLHFNVTELKLLAVLYSVILNDYHATLDIEQRIEEIISSERNAQTDNIINTTLLNDSLVMIATSIAKQRGLILNTNRGQLARFFGYADEKEFNNILYVDQLMPTYVQQLHDKMISRYLKRGHSVLIDQSREVYINMKNNFLKAVNLNLLHMFENEMDYIVTGVIRKVKQNSDFLIFDRQGKILGTSESIFQVLGAGLSLDEFLSKGYIYFWFHKIINEMEQCNVMQSQEQNVKLGGQNKTQLIYPVSDFQQLYQMHELAKSTSPGRIQETENILTNHTNLMLFSSIKATPTVCFSEQNIQLINDFVSKISHSKIYDLNNPYYIKYSMSFNVLGEDLLPVYVLQINEMDKKRSAASHTTGAMSRGSQVYDTTNNNITNEDKFDYKVDDEKSDSINIHSTIINKINIFPVTQNIQYPNYTVEQCNIFSVRGNKTKENLIEEEFEDNTEHRRVEQNVRSSSINEDSKKNIVDIILQNRDPNNFTLTKAKQSLSSNASDKTQISVFNILRTLQYTPQYQTTLIKVMANTVTLIIFLVILVVIELVISRNNTNTLQSQIPLIRLPDKFNRLYCTFTVIAQIDLEMKLLGFNQDNYVQYRIQNEGKTIRSELLALVVQVQDQFSVLDQQGKLQNASIAIANQYTYIVQSTSLLQFCQMVDEYTSAINTLFWQNDDESLINEQIRLLFLKGNLISLINLVSNLVENIAAEFFANIANYQSTYLIFLFVQLVILTAAILMQFQQWIGPYQYKENILLLICRVPEKDIEQLILKYKSFRDLLQNEVMKWKQVNYYQEFFSWKGSKLKIKTAGHISILPSKASKNKASVNLRIQNTKYSIAHIYLMLLFFWVLLSSYAMSSYFFESASMANSQPELNLCMQFVRFKQEFDSFMIISQFIKNQPLLSEYQAKSGIYEKNPEYHKTDGFFKTLSEDLVQQFSSSVSAGNELYQTIYDNIVASTKISTTNKNVLLGLYQDDLCNYIEGEMPFCHYENGTFEHFPDYPESDAINNYRERLRQGFNGLYQAIRAIFSSRYEKELNGKLDTNSDEIKAFMETPEYKQLLLPYFFDLDKAIVKFYATIITASIDILETDFQNYLSYYTSYGICSLLVFFFIVMHQARKIQRQIRAIRQSLVLLPHESLLDIQTYNAIKRFEQQI